MDTNNPETSPSPTGNMPERSVIRCPQTSNLVWDLNETTIPWIAFPITIVVSLATIVSNLLVILSIQRKRELKKTSTILLCSMAVADLLVGAISMPLTVASDILIIRQVFYSGICALRVATEYSMFPFAWSSLYHLTLIAWERYMAIRKWMDYKIIVTSERVKLLAAVAWLLAAFTSLPPLVMIAAGADKTTKEGWFIGASVVAVVCLIAIVYFYIMVYLEVRNRKVSDISQVTDQVKAKQESKVAITTGLITATLILSFFGVIVVAGLGEVFPVLRTNKACRLPESLLMINSLVNPLIYFYRDRRLRNAALELLGFKRHGKVHPTAGDARPVGRKDLPDSLVNVQELKETKHHTPSKRAAFRDPADQPRTFPDSAPTLDKNSSPLDGHQLQQASPAVVTTVLIHTESGGRDQGKTAKRESPQDAMKKPRNVPRSTSWDSGATDSLIVARGVGSKIHKLRKFSTGSANVQQT